MTPDTTPNTFKQFGFPKPIEQALDAMKFSTPTPIQSQAIPHGLAGKDVLGIAQTGTGKTAAFSLPILVHLLKSPGETALVLAPTRELAQQIEEFWHRLTRFVPQMRAVLVLGGASMSQQVRGLKAKPRLIIATPGRMVDHIEQRTVDLSQCTTLVLDEADRMLDMGFAPQLNRIRAALANGRRRTMLFSATWGKEMDELSKKYLRDPVKVSVGPISQAAKTVAQMAIFTTTQGKNDTLLDEINKRQGSVLVFTRTKHRTDRVAKYLASYGLDVNRLHGGRTQGQRTQALAGFREGRVRILVATDIAARGIDVAQIQHVINYDVPRAPEDYIHRIGRTGRAGAEGSAVSFVTGEDKDLWNAILKLLDKTGSPKPETRKSMAQPAARPQQPAQQRQAKPQQQRPAQPHPQRAQSQRPHGGQSQRPHGGGHSRPQRPLQPHERGNAQRRDFSGPTGGDGLRVQRKGEGAPHGGRPNRGPRRAN